MIKLAILASGNGTNAQAILEAVQSGELQADVKVVLTNKPQAGVIARAQKFNVPVEIIPSKGIKDRDAYDAAVVECLEKYGVDTIALAGWMRILSNTFLDSFPDRIINLHPAILPSFTGGTGIQDAFDYGVKITGCTVHLVTPVLDAGPIIIQAGVPVGNDVDVLEAQIHRMEHMIFVQALKWFAQDRLSVSGRTVNLKPAGPGVTYCSVIEGCLVNPPIENQISL